MSKDVLTGNNLYEDAVNNLGEAIKAYDEASKDEMHYHIYEVSERLSQCKSTCSLI
jgi:hypothetical protein